MDCDGDGVETGHHGGQAWATRVMAVLVPPAIFEKVQAVFDSPMAAHVAKKILGGYRAGIEATDEVANVVRNDVAALGSQFSIDAQRDPAARQVERFADVVGVV